MHDVIDKEKFKPMGWDEKRSKIEISPACSYIATQIGDELINLYILDGTLHVL